MVRRKQFFEDGQGLFVELLGFGFATAGADDVGEVGGGKSGANVPGTERFLHSREGLALEGFGFGVPFSRGQERGEIVLGNGGFRMVRFLFANGLAEERLGFPDSAGVLERLGIVVAVRAGGFQIEHLAKKFGGGFAVAAGLCQLGQPGNAAGFLAAVIKERFCLCGAALGGDGLGEERSDIRIGESLAEVDFSRNGVVVAQPE